MTCLSLSFFLPVNKVPVTQEVKIQIQLNRSVYYGYTHTHTDRQKHTHIDTRQVKPWPQRYHMDKLHWLYLCVLLKEAFLYVVVLLLFQNNAKSRCLFFLSFNEFLTLILFKTLTPFMWYRILVEIVTEITSNNSWPVGLQEKTNAVSSHLFVMVQHSVTIWHYWIMLCQNTQRYVK